MTIHSGKLKSEANVVSTPRRRFASALSIVAALLVYEQSLVSDDDLSQVRRAFDLNGWVGIVYFVATALALYIG